ncbi:B12-binding domain-containing radical SAM protein [Candidatus Woesearchaeota archaeon]|nr:B12-binding domain-containing radical SAM protein [Candidatus Woesearchaeota archaeon]
MTRVALVRLEYHLDDYDFANEHIGIGYLTSVLRQNGINTKIFDNTLTSNRDLSEQIVEFSPDVIGYSSNCTNTQEVIEFSKSIPFTKKPVKIFGGPNATFSAKDLLEYEDVDAIVLGEGEITTLELIKAIEEGRNLSEVKGIAYREGENYIFTESRGALANLDTLPTPARDVLEASLKIGKQSVARVISSRGCYYNCNFCTTPAMRKINPGNIYRERDPVKVVNEIEELVNKYGIQFIYFNDDLYFSTLAKSRQRATRIAQELIRREVPVHYKIEIRSDSINPNEDQDFIKLLRNSGLYRVFVGMESGSKNMLDYLGKRISVEDSKSFIKFMQTSGIKVNVGKILFGPHTTWDELRDSVNSFYELGLCSELLRRPNKRLEAFPGTRITSQLQQEGRLEDKVPYLHRNYSFKDSKIGEFDKVLALSFSKYFPLLREYFEKRAYSSVTDGLESEVNNACFSFFMNNINLDVRWTLSAFDESVNRFIEDLGGILK